jgi:selenocysteine lyase/cysteine desulfurase
LRITLRNAETGGIDVDAIVSLIDEETSRLCVVYASNMSGAKLDIANIVARAREHRPYLFTVMDQVTWRDSSA